MKMIGKDGKVLVPILPPQSVRRLMGGMWVMMARSPVGILNSSNETRRSVPKKHCTGSRQDIKGYTRSGHYHLLREKHATAGTYSSRGWWLT